MTQDIDCGKVTQQQKQQTRKSALEEKMSGEIFTGIGQIVATRGVANVMAENSPFAGFTADALHRYMMKDFGDICEEDQAVNDDALKFGNRVMAVYNLPEEIKEFAKNQFGGQEDRLWIITEADRSVTTLLFSSEY